MSPGVQPNCSVKCISGAVSLNRTKSTANRPDAEAQREADWAHKFAEVVRTTQTAAIANVGFGSLQKLLEAVSTVLIVFLGVRGIIRNDLTAGVLYAFMAYRTQFMARTISLFEQVVSWRMLDIYTYRLADVVLTATEPNIDRTPRGLPASRISKSRIVRSCTKRPLWSRTMAATRTMSTPPLNTGTGS